MPSKNRIPMTLIAIGGLIILSACQHSSSRLDRCNANMGVGDVIESSRVDLIKSLEGRSRNQIEVALRVISDHSRIRVDVSTDEKYSTQGQSIRRLIEDLKMMNEADYYKLNNVYKQMFYLSSPYYSDDFWGETKCDLQPLPPRRK